MKDMDHNPTPTKHERIQQQILSSCSDLKIQAIPEYRGSNWRADVFIPDEQRPIAFEIQLSPQSLKKNLDRQTKYNQERIVGCWLFEKPVPKLYYERQSLPLFYVEEDSNLNLQVNLYDRRKVPLADFLHNFISNNIQFKTTVKTKTKQLVRLVFYEFRCWKCHDIICIM
jgi:competence CoiA-like predicted nuclease